MARKFGTQGTAPLFPGESDWKAPALTSLPTWSNAKRVALDTEFRDKTLRELGCGARRGAKLAGYSFMLDGDRPYYVPLRHPGGGNVDEQQGLSYIRDNLINFKGEIVTANGTGDLDILETTENVKPNYDQVLLKDIQIAGPIIWELHKKYSLEIEAARWGFEGKDKTLLKETAINYGWDVKKAGWEACIPELPCKYIGPYGEHDVRVLLPTLDAQEAAMKQQGLMDGFLLECRLTPVVLKMRQRGVLIDFDHLDKVEKWALQEEINTTNEIKHLTGWDIGLGNCMTNRMVAPALQAIGVEVPKDTRGLYSITKELLFSIDHKVSKLIRYLREVNKLRKTFVASVRKYATNGRVHTTFRQIVGATEKNEKGGAAFGRLSSAHPNLQQQPSRAKYASFWRQIYVAEKGMTWISSDLSAQEPRWIAHFADLLGLRGAGPLVQEYKTNSRMDPHSALARLIYGDGFTKDDRAMGKLVLLATAYGQGGAKLCKEQLKLPTRWLLRTEEGDKQYFETRAEAMKFRHKFEGKCKIHEVAGLEGQAILDKFHSGAPFVRELAQRVQEKVEAAGVLNILGGRKIHFPINQDGSYDWAYKGLNRIVQGSSGMQVKLSMLAIEKEFPGFLRLQIHDEVCGSVADLHMAKRIAEIMEQTVIGRVPFRCEVEAGTSWGNQRVICFDRNCINYADPKDKFGCELHKLKHAC